MNIITYHQAISLGEIVQWSRDSKKVARCNTDGEVTYGIARAICSEPNGGFVNEHHDVRDGFMWVTTREGWEEWWPVRTLMDEHAATTFTQYDW